MYQISGPLLKNCDREHPDRRTDRHTEDRNRGNPVETEIPHRARYWSENITGLQNSAGW